MLQKTDHVQTREENTNQVANLCPFKISQIKDFEKSKFAPFIIPAGLFSETDIFKIVKAAILDKGFQTEMMDADKLAWSSSSVSSWGN